MKDLLKQLQGWYASQCGEDWEHSYGVKIDTLDNPGWMLVVDLVDTEFSELSVPMDRIDRTDADWAQHEVVDGRFVACGGALNLEELIVRFLRTVGVAVEG
jgi:hypothetical protein